jgi:hypothetical protein
MGFLDTSSTLIPMDIAQIDEARARITVSADKQTVKDGPTFDDDREITPEYEDEVRSYYGLGSLTGADTAGGYGDHYVAEDEDANYPRPRLPLLSGGKDPTLAERFEEELYGTGR